MPNPLPGGVNDPTTRRRLCRLMSWSPKRRAAVIRLWERGGSPRFAIKMACLECCGEDVDGIRDCGDHCCPLWHHRPFANKPKDNDETQR